MTALRRFMPYLALLPWLLVLLLLPLHPTRSLEAAARGAAIWWDVLFPALLPFAVMAELLVGLGIMHFIGSLFDPMMRPLFRVPGYGGFVMAMGYASGYPIGAKLTAGLRERKLLSREEGERLVAFVTTSDPIFLIGAVSVGFFHDASLAAVLAAAHYGGGLLVGLAMRFHGPAEPQAADKDQADSRRKSFLRRTFAAMHKARLEDGRPFGVMLQDAVAGGLRLVLVIGGLVVFFSVVLELFAAVGLMDLLYASAARMFHWLRVPETLSRAAVDGAFEVTLGTKAAGAAPSAVPLVHKAAVAAFILSWAGLCVHAQIVSLLTRTGLRYAPFLAARLMHGCFAFVLVYALWKPLSPIREAAAGLWPYGISSAASFLLGAPLCLIVFLSVLLAIPPLYAVFLGVSRLLVLLGRAFAGPPASGG